MTLSPKAVEELKVLFRKHRGQALGDEEAWAMANRLLRVYHAITRPRQTKGSNSAPVDQHHPHQ
jgi:hypothetical protein